MCWGKNIWGLGLSLLSCHYQNIRFATAAPLCARSVDFHSKLEITNNYEGLTKTGSKVAQKLPCNKKIDLLAVEWLLNLNIFTWARCFIINEITGSFIVEFVSNKAEGQISKWVSQEDSTPNFSKNEHFLPPDSTLHHYYTNDQNFLVF